MNRLSPRFARPRYSLGEAFTEKGRTRVPTVKDALQVYNALSPRQQEAFSKQIKLRQHGPDALTRKQVHRAVWTVLNERFPRIDNWVLTLTPKKLAALPLDDLKRTFEGRMVFQSKGQKGFERWAAGMKEKVKNWIGLQMKQLEHFVAIQVGPNPARLKRLKNLQAKLKQAQRATTKQKIQTQINELKGGLLYRGGNLHRWTVEEKDRYLMGWYGLAWEAIPRNLRDKRQRGIKNDYSHFRQRQEDFLFPPADKKI